MCVVSVQFCVRCVNKNVFSFHLMFRAMSHDLHSTSSILSSFSPSSTSPSSAGSGSRLITSRIHCADSRGRRGDGFTDPEPRTGYEPKRTVDNPFVKIPEIEDKGKELKNGPFSLPDNQSLLSSTQGSIESLATPQEADLDDEQIRALLASPRYSTEREASAERSQSCHYERAGLMSSLPRSLNFMSTGEPVVRLSHQKRLGQNEFSERTATC